MSSEKIWAHLVDQFHNMSRQGYTRLMLNMEIDTRFINAARVIYKSFLNSQQYQFKQYQLDIIRWCWIAFRKHKKIDHIEDADAYCADIKEELEKHSFPEGTSNLRKATVFQLFEKFSEIQLSGQPFVIYEYNPDDDYEAELDPKDRHIMGTPYKHRFVKKEDAH